MPGQLTITSRGGPLIVRMTVDVDNPATVDLVELGDSVSIEIGGPDTALQFLGQRSTIHGLIIEADRLLAHKGNDQ